MRVKRMLRLYQYFFINIIDNGAQMYRFCAFVRQLSFHSLLSPLATVPS